MLRAAVGHARRAAVTALAVAIASPTVAAPRTATVDLAAVVQFGDNLSRAVRSDETEQAARFRMEVFGRRPVTAGDGRGAGLEGHLGLETVTDFDALDRVDAGLRTRWTLAPGSGFGRASLAVEAGATGLLHRDSPIRDGALFDLGLVTGTRSTDRLSWEAGYRFELRRARRGNVWDTHQHRLFLHGEHRTTRALAVWIRAGVATGDVVATGRPSQRLLDRSAARVDDDAFETGRIAYRLDGEEASLALGAAWQPAPTLGLEVALAHRWIEAGGGLEYDASEATASAVWRLR
jgi:hypothetical protein